MDPLLFHPKIVHLPIALMVLMPLLSGGLLLAWLTEWLPRRTWWIAVLLQAVLVSTSYFAMESGEAEEERVEDVVPEAALEAHEEAAEVFAWATLAPLLLMVAAAAVPDRRLAGAVGAGSVLAAVVVAGLGYRVGEAGGALVYTHDAAAAYAGPAAARPLRHDDDDD